MIGSQARFAGLLRLPLGDLRYLLSLQNYKVWTASQKQGEKLAGLPARKSRTIQQPKPVLNMVLKRLAYFLSRIQKPDFVFSASKERSYVDNAKRHMNAERAVKVDIRSFYPSVSRRLVRDFFADQMKCAPDVASLIANLCCTVVGEPPAPRANDTPMHRYGLPTGSPVSPALSYFACSQLFERIAEFATRHKVAFTLYVDDMFFSGQGADEKFARAVFRELRSAGFKGHKISYFEHGQTKIITGVAVDHDSLGMPHKRRYRLRKFENAFWRCKEPSDCEILGASLKGQYREATRLDPSLAARAAAIESRLLRLRSSSGTAKRARKSRGRGSRRNSRMAIASAVKLLREKVAATFPANTSSQVSVSYPESSPNNSASAAG